MSQRASFAVAKIMTTRNATCVMSGYVFERIGFMIAAITASHAGIKVRQSASEWKRKKIGITQS